MCIEILKTDRTQLKLSKYININWKERNAWQTQKIETSLLERETENTNEIEENKNVWLKNADGYGEMLLLLFLVRLAGACHYVVGTHV